jgi:Sulfatase-modifying factor enzyme 1
LADTAGNASEWVYDWFDVEYYVGSPRENPTGPVEGDLRVVRGSHYESELEAIPLYLRSALDPVEHNAHLGFRCVLTGEAVGSPPPRACGLPPYSLPDMDVEQLPEPDILSVSALGYCIDTEEVGPLGYVNLVFDQPVQAGDYNIASGAGSVTVTQDSSQLDTLVLSGPGIPLGQVFELTVCTVLPPSPMSEAEPICPTGYVLDTITGKCRYVELSSENICAEGFAWLEGYGYVEVETDPFQQFLLELVCDLLPGYEIVELSDSPLTLACLPVDGPADCGSDQDCSTNTTCLPGTTYESIQDCCVYPPAFEPYCLAGYTYDPMSMMCIPDNPEEQCISTFLYIPSCKPPVVVGCQNPGQYTDQSSCEAAQCKWVFAAGIPPFCTNP